MNYKNMEESLFNLGLPRENINKFMREVMQQNNEGEFSMKVGSLKPVEVEWIDAQSGFSSPLSFEEMIDCNPIITRSMGYLIYDDDEKIILAFMVWDSNCVKHWQLIPKGMVQKITPLHAEEKQ